MNRRAPIDGYSFGNKRQYRREVWATFRRVCCGSLATSHALLMPSAEGEEIEVALNNGFREHNLHVVDDNPAIVAHLKRRYPRLNTYGSRVSRASERIKKLGVKLSAANLDMCSQLSAPIESEIRAFVDNDVLVDGACVAVTILRGREQGESRDLVRLLSGLPSSHPALPERWGNDSARIGLLASYLLQKAASKSETDPFWIPVNLRFSKYRSIAGHQTMLWSAWRMYFRDKRWLCDISDSLSHDFWKTHSV